MESDAHANNDAGLAQNENQPAESLHPHEISDLPLGDKAATEIERLRAQLDELKMQNDELKNEKAEQRGVISDLSSQNENLLELIGSVRAEKDEAVEKFERERLLCNDLNVQLNEKESMIQELQRGNQADLKKKIEKSDREKAALESKIADQDVELRANESLIEYLEKMPVVGAAIVTYRTKKLTAALDTLP